MSETVLKIEGLSKDYKMFARKKDRIIETLFPGVERHGVFEAMHDFNLEVKKGEVLGVLGKNGAGKSTLLKMITGVVTPTKGTIEAKGKISSLLELGTAFNQELTGYENIYQHGQVMGLTNEEIKAREQEIIDFADIGDHLYQPVKTYSSGMFARLAFACAINVNPDILIVDEVLSVGDMSFQLKCFKKFEQFKKRGKTILFVTHNITDVIRNCTRTIIINDGKKIYDGDVKGGVERYKKIIVKLDKDMNVVKTYDIKYATYLNLVGEKLYYTDKDHHICVLDTKTEKTETLQDVSAFYMTYHDNKLYYQNDSDNESLYVYDILNKTSTKLLDEHIYNMNFNGDIIYLTGKSSIISYNMTTQATDTIYNEQVYGSVYNDGYLYFSTPKMAIGRVNVETKQSETIMDDIGYSMFVMSDEAIYYVGNDAKMYRIDLSTKKTTAVYQFQSHRISGMQIVNDHLFVKDNQDWKVVNTSNTKYAVIFEN